MDFNKNLPYYLLLAFLLSFVILVLQSEGTAGGADDINHYRYARYSFINPGFFFDTKAKTVFTLICAPVAQLGYNALRIFNVLLGLAAAFLTFLTARKLNYKQPVMALFLLVFAPMYTLMMMSGMNEIMFSFFLVLGMYLFFRNKSIWSAVIISLLPFIRTEGFIIFPLFMLAFMMNRQWKALPFIFSGFLGVSLAGSFYVGDFFWVITKNPYSGNASDIYGSGELLYYVDRYDLIFGLPLFVLVVLGLLFIPIYLLRSGKEKRPAFINEILVGFLPFLLYFSAHSYVWWKGMGNSVGETRVMAAVFPSAVLLALFAWKHLMGLLGKFGKNTRNAIGIILATWLVFVPFRAYTIPVPLGRTQQLIKEAAIWLEETEYAERKIYFWDPFWWFFLDKAPIGNPNVQEGVYSQSDPGKNIRPGEIILWEAHYGPNEGRLPLERLRYNTDFAEIKVFRPLHPFKVLGGYDYEVHIFERRESPKIREMQTILEEIQNPGEEPCGIRILEYIVCEQVENEDSTILRSVITKSGSSSCLLNDRGAFLPGIELPFEKISSPDQVRFIIKISHLFESFNQEKDPFHLVMSIQRNEEIRFYYTWDITPQNLQTWEETVIEYDLPDRGSGADIVKLYLWNKGGHHVSIDDFVIAIMEPWE